MGVPPHGGRDDTRRCHPDRGMVRPTAD